MLPISHTIELIIRRTPFLEDGLASGLLNLSAIARKIRPEIEQKHLRTVTDAAIIMALTRIADQLKTKDRKSHIPLTLKDITVETNLTEYVFKHSPTMVQFHRKLVELIENKEECMNYSQGLFETTALVSANLEAEVERLAATEKMIKKISQICAVTLRMNQDTVTMPGVYYRILKALAWENINLLEVISVYSELTLLFEEKDIDRAFSVVKGLARS